MQKQLFTKTRWLVTIILLATLSIGQMWGEGTESFENLTSATNYASRSWTGTNGQTGWAATNARTDQKTAGSRGLTFKASTASTITMKLTSAQQSAGFGVLTFKYTYPYSDSGKSRELSITIGGNTYSSGTLSYTSSVTTGTITVNQSLASATVTINVDAGGGRICVDEFSWTSYSAGTSVTLSKGASSNGSFTLSPASPVTTTSGAQNVTVSCTPNTGYYVSNVTATNPATGTATVTGSGNSWNVQYSSGANGTSTISVTFSPSSGWKLKGTFDSWGDGYAMSGSGTVSVTRSLAANTRYEFKFVDGLTYYGNTGAIVHSVSDWTFATDKDNCVLYTGPAGDYTFSINTSTKAASISYPSVDHPNANYVYIKKGGGWSDARIYNWDSNSEARMSDWDGSPVLATCEICGTTYYYGAACFNKIIFRDGGSNQSNEVSLDRGKWLDETTHASSWSNFATYTISYAGGGGSGSMSSHTNLCPGSSQQLTANAFSKAYHTFNGWSDGNGHTYANQATITNIQSNINLTAQWAPAQYNITAALTNVTSTTSFPVVYTYTGSAAGVTYTFAAADGFRLPDAVTVTGSTYTWNQATGQLTLTGTITGNVSITISGTQTHTVTWNVNGVTVSAASLGLASNPVVYDHGGSLVLPPTDPSVPGGCPDKVFMGWTAHTEITTETSDAPSFVSAGTAVNADVTYRAVFADKDDTGGSATTTINGTGTSSWTKTGTSGGGSAGTTGLGSIVIGDVVTLTLQKCYIQSDEIRIYSGEDVTFETATSAQKITYIRFYTKSSASSSNTADNLQAWIDDGTGNDVVDPNGSTIYNSVTSKYDYKWDNSTGANSVLFTATGRTDIGSITISYTSVSYDNYITICSSCTTPSDLAVPTKTSTTGKVTWNGVSLSPSEGFKVAWNTTDSRPGTLNASNSADVAAGTNEYTINGLTPATRYYVWVQSKCNSTWSSSVNFYTNAKITYAAGTGSGSMTPKEVAYNTNATVDACTFTPPAYHVFNGWVSNQSVTVGGSSTTSVGDGATITNLTQAITLTAQWRVNSYNLTWDLGGGTTTSAGTGIASGVSANTTTSVAYGTSLTAPTVTREGYTFSSWSPSVASTMPAAATTYTAQWTANEYTVTWKVNGSNYSEGGSTSVNHGSKVTTLPTAPDPGDYCGDVFVGWTDATDGAYVHETSNLYKTASEFPEATGNQIFYAVFADYAE